MRDYGYISRFLPDLCPGKIILLNIYVFIDILQEKY